MIFCTLPPPPPPQERIKLEDKLKKLRKEKRPDEAAIRKLLCLLDPEEAQRQNASVMPKVLTHAFQRFSRRSLFMCFKNN